MTRVDRQDCILLVARGDLDTLADGQLLRSACDALKELSGRPLVIDLSGLAFAGSGAASDLIMIEYEASRYGYPLRIVLGGNRPMRRLLTVLGLHQHFPSFDSIDDAINH